jgi:ribokinase
MDMIFTTERIPDSGESVDALSLFSFPGGKGANTTIAVYRASHTRPIPRDAITNGLQRGCNVYKDESDIQVCMNSAVRDNEAGKTLRRKLAEAGVDISGVHIIENKISGTSVVMVGGHRRQQKLCSSERQSEMEGSRAELVGVPYKWISNTRSGHLTLGVSREQTERALEMTSVKGVDTFWNPSPAALWSKGDNVMGPLRSMKPRLQYTMGAVLSGRSAIWA